MVFASIRPPILKSKLLHKAVTCFHACWLLISLFVSKVQIDHRPLQKHFTRPFLLPLHFGFIRSVYLYPGYKSMCWMIVDSITNANTFAFWNRTILTFLCLSLFTCTFYHHHDNITHIYNSKIHTVRFNFVYVLKVKWNNLWSNWKIRNLFKISMHIQFNMIPWASHNFG